MTRPRRLKAPRAQAPRDDQRPRPVSPMPITEPPELIYQAYGKALDWRGPKGTRLRLWHELSVHDRRGWRAAFAELRLMLLTSQYVPGPRPGPGEVTLIVSDDTGWTTSVIPRKDLNLAASRKAAFENLDVALAKIRLEAEVTPVSSPEEATPGD